MSIPTFNTFDFGTGAAQLPGPEELGPYDPHQLIDGAQATAELPEHPDCYVRWFPHRPTGLLPSDYSARETIITDNQRHLDALQRVSGYALLVVSHRSFVGPHPHDPSVPAIMSVVEKVSGDQGTPQDPRSAASLYANAKYLGWVIASGEQHILGDSLKASQSMLGLINRHTDIDPLFSPVRDPQATLKTYLGYLRVWRQIVQHRSRSHSVPYITRSSETLAELDDLLVKK